MAEGQLVPDELIEELVERRLDDHDWNFGFVLEGFPRNVGQARFFLEGYDIDAVILIDVPEAVVFERMLSRRLCSRCGLDYNLISHRPAGPGTCDVCHGRLVQRPDDTPDAIRARLHDYDGKTRPIVELFRAKGWCWWWTGRGRRTRCRRRSAAASRSNRSRRRRAPRP